MNPEPSPALQMRRSKTPDGRTRLEITGSLDVDGAPQLADELNKLLDSGARAVVLDVSRVSFVSSLGIGCLIAAVGDFQQAKAELVVTGVSEDLRQLFVMLDLLDYITVR